MQNDDIFQKLLKWLGILEDYTAELHEQRLVFERVKEIAQRNSEIHTGNVFFEHLNIWYASSMSMGVRRLVDQDKQAISYVQFLKLIEKNPRAISRTRIVRSWDGNDLANKAFDKYAGVGEEFLPVGFVDSDLAELISKTKIITDFTDKFIAHRDLGPPPPIPMFEDLSSGLEILERTNNKYGGLFTGYTGSLTPSIAYPWEEIFRIRWIP